MSLLSFFFFKQKTAYEMRISDWSSDLCSSDLRTAVRTAGLHHQPDRLAGPDVQAAALDHVAVHRGVEIRVVLDVVDVAVDVVVHPARRDRLKMPVILASRIRCPALAVAHRPAPDGTARARKSRMASRVSFGRSMDIMCPVAGSTTSRASGRASFSGPAWRAGVIRSSSPARISAGQRTRAAAASAP